MNGNMKDEPKPVRLLFELARADNPRLYDELVRFPQGVKRVNRLRVLAYDGLLAQYGVFASATDRPMANGMTAPVPATVTNQVFESGLVE